MYCTSKLLIIIASFATANSQMLECIPCANKYRVNIKKSFSSWCPEFPIDNDVIYLAPYTGYDHEFDNDPCIPCSQIDDADDYFELCDRLTTKNVTRYETLAAEEDTNAVLCGMDYTLDDTIVLYNGRCERLWHKGPCSKDQILLFGSNGLPKCSRRPCRGDRLKFNSICVKLNSISCGSNALPYMDAYGEIKCDCKVHFARDEVTGKCIRRQNKGSCRTGWLIEMALDGYGVCVPQLCPLNEIFADIESVRYLQKSQEGCYRRNICYHITVFIDGELRCLSRKTALLTGPGVRGCPGGQGKQNGICRPPQTIKARIESVQPTFYQLD